MAAWTRDPLSEWWDTGAQIVLQRAVSARGQWVGVRIADPSQRQRDAALALGIAILGPDPVRKLGGRGVNARDRWRRAFVRAVYYNSGRPIEIEVGVKLPARGVIPAGRPVRIRTRRGGQAAMNAVGRMADVRRIYDDEGKPAARWADPRVTRDW